MLQYKCLEKFLGGLGFQDLEECHQATLANKCEDT